MKVSQVELSLAELQAALRDYCANQGVVPEVVNIVSHNSAIQVELAPGGLVTADTFRHRAEVAA